MPLTRNIQKLVHFFGKAHGFDRAINGLKVIHANEGKVTCELEVKQEHVNASGTLHGGMTSTLIDVVSTYAIGTTKENKFGVSVDMSISFLSPAMPGETITIKSEVLRTGRQLAFANVDIFKEDGKLVATGRHTKYLDAGRSLPGTHEK